MMHQSTCKVSNPMHVLCDCSCLQVFQPEPSNCGANTRMRGVSDLAQQLMADACQGTDPALVIALPHTRQLSLYRSQGACAHTKGCACGGWCGGQ
jgi:hypothetical protein